MDCPREDTLAELADGRLDAITRDDLYRHLETCRSCDLLVADLARALAASGEPAADADAFLAVGATIDRYRIVACLGSGAMGTVYRARDPKLDRDVALKVLRAAASGVALAEARALARLSHPHIVPVHDAGEHDGHAFIAMDLVEGVSLRRAERLRSYAHALRALLPVADALAAAHGAGVVHGDIKPDNLLVAPDGRLLVADFGLARVRSETAARIGFTPAYAAPEQLAGAHATEAADQFALAATLHECAVGRADPAVGYAELARAFAAGTWDRASQRALPRAARTVLSRAFAADPARRFPSIDRFAAALRAGTTRRRRLVQGGALAAAMLASATAVYMWRGDDAEPCNRDGSVEAVQAVWSPARAMVLGARLGATKHPMAAELGHMAIAGLESYAAAWVDMSVASCRATHVAGTQSPEMLDRRTACLDARRRELGALATALEQPLTRAELELAPSAAQRLPAVRDCAELDQLAAVDRLPTDILRRARAAAIEEAVAAAAAAERLGLFPAARARAADAFARATQLDEPLALAHAASELATTELRLGQYDAMVDHDTRAAAAATRAGDASFAVSVFSTVAQVVGLKQQKPKEAAVWLHAAEVAAAQKPSAKALAGLYSAQRALAELTGDYPAALQHAEEAVHAYEPHGEDFALAGLLVELGNLRVRMKLPTAAAAWERALRIEERVLGPNHPSLATVISNLGFDKVRAKDFAGGEALILRAHAIREAALAPNHPELGLSHTNLAELYIDAQQLDKAEQHLAAAAKIFDRAVGSDHMYQTRVLDLRGDLELGTGKFAAAEADHRRALEITAKTYGADSPHLAANLLGIGHAQWALARPVEALATLRRAKQLLAGPTSSERDDLKLIIDFYTARALWDTKQHALSVQIARTLATALRGRPPIDQLAVADVDAWLAQHKA